MQQSVETIEINKGTKICDVFDAARTLLILLNIRKQLALLVGHALFDQLTTRNNYVSTLVADLNHFKIKALTDKLVNIANRCDINL